MIGIVTMNHRAVKMLKRRVAHEHKKMHIERANAIRNNAEIARDAAIKMAQELGIDNDHVMAEIDAQYNNVLAEAIAEENSKCMEGSH